MSVLDYDHGEAAQANKFAAPSFTPCDTLMTACYSISAYWNCELSLRALWAGLETPLVTHPSPALWNESLTLQAIGIDGLRKTPLIFSGLSMMKLPFHTMASSTARSLIFTPSYMYWKTVNSREWRKDGKAEERMKGRRWDEWLFNHLSSSTSEDDALFMHCHRRHALHCNRATKRRQLISRIHLWPIALVLWLGHPQV